MPLPRPRLGDHLRVAGLLVATVLGAIPFLLHLLVAPVASPLARRRLSRALSGTPSPPVEPPPPDPAAWAGKTVFVVAGEASGDRLAARVVEALERRAPGLVVRGYAGPACAQAGAVLDREIVEHAVVGFFGVARSLPTWWGLCAEALAVFREEPPDVLLTVDFPGLNLRLARWARKRGVRAVHLVGPQTWAWASWRTRRLRRAVDALLVTFPFEPAVFRDAGVPADFVGHPLFEAPLPPPASPPSWSSPDDEPGPLVELRPGSRVRDVRRQAPVVLDAARGLALRFPHARFVARLASEKGADAFRAAGPGPERLEVRVGDGALDGPVALAVTTSGTSTAELAAAQVPMVVFYAVPGLVGRLGAWLFVTSPHVAMANLLAGRRLVPERLVSRAGGGVVAHEAALLLLHRERWESVRSGLGEVRARLSHPNVADRVARAVLRQAGVRDDFHDSKS
jgi:lipid-A-disaccharide synthase